MSKANVAKKEARVSDHSALEIKFERWHADNPHIYELFKRFAKEWAAAGGRHCSGWLIINRIRWETGVTTRGDLFKICNDFIAIYARKFMREFPRYEGLFVIRPAKRLRAYA